MVWAGARLLTAQDLDLSPPSQATHQSLLKPRKLGAEGVDRREGDVSALAQSKRSLRPKWLCASKDKSFAKKNGKMGLPENRLSS